MYDAIISVVSFSDVVTALTAIAALIAVVLVVKRGSAMLLSMISAPGDDISGGGMTCGRCGADTMSGPCNCS